MDTFLEASACKGTRKEGSRFLTVLVRMLDMQLVMLIALKETALELAGTERPINSVLIVNERKRMSKCVLNPTYTAGTTPG